MTAEFDERLAGLRARFQERAAISSRGLSAAAEAGDLAELVRIAHILAGSAGLFGYAELSTVASKVELAAERGHQAALDRLMPQLIEHLQTAAQGR